ncbi:hypothetical protein PMAYCL1PPCAC_09516 [Pristionchus mayeri]|uniref:DNA2/NAM7 helicase-like C-terminal domain-containing protein n=1 Tax=Pristionchus mayeri TaxID=1317129 RepID=A0AAN5CEX9_9BILA|nr:hypothetical protein PMAYCL1PPCAC_09516 [Pristionchus mayeri]
MALAFSKLDYGSLRAIHFISSEREDLMTEETSSPFSVLSLAKENESIREKIEPLELELKSARNNVERDMINNKIDALCKPVKAEQYDVFFGTVDMILGRLRKGNQGGKHQEDAIKKQLRNSVRRVVVDEASQLTEAALNALILSFPKAQIVLIGDSKQLPQFRYKSEDVVSALSARPALEVAKDKINLPVIKLTRVYRATQDLISHYSDVFYKGTLKTMNKENYSNPISCFRDAHGGRCIFWKVPKGVANMLGTSKYNYIEIRALRFILNRLRSNGHDHKSVMIISYYEAQRRKAEEELEQDNLSGYELLTVDSAQGRKKKIVIVLTACTYVPVDAGAFFDCKLRCNVAVSRHQEALIVIGHPSIASAPNWAQVLSPKYFRHVDDRK